MLLPALLVVLAPTLLPTATVQASAVLAPCGPTCPWLSEPSAPSVELDVRPASGHGGVGPVPASCSDGSVVTGALPPVRAVAEVSQLAESPPADAPAQTPQTTTPAPPAADRPTGTGLERWQATIVAVVAAGAIVWLTGRLRRMGRKG